MSKHWKPGRKTVELRPSRLHRDPPAARAGKAVHPYPSQQEVWMVAVGVIMFTIAFAALIFGISDITSH